MLPLQQRTSRRLEYKCCKSVGRHHCLHFSMSEGLQFRVRRGCRTAPGLELFPSACTPGVRLGDILRRHSLPVVFPTLQYRSLYLPGSGGPCEPIAMTCDQWRPVPPGGGPVLSVNHPQSRPAGVGESLSACRS